jgi:hypothetical protein
LELKEINVHSDMHNPGNQMILIKLTNFELPKQGISGVQITGSGNGITSSSKNNVRGDKSLLLTIMDPCLLWVK